MGIRHILFYRFCFIAILFWTCPGWSLHNQIWIHVDTDQQILTVYDGETPKDSFKNIAIGQAGTTLHKRHGDDKTQLGRYQITWVNHKSRFRTFYGFNYPNIEDAKRALADGRITQSAADKIINAHLQHQTPSQHTGLGGMLGIHGLGRADPDIHKRVNWTHGCIALTNEQIDRLGKWVSIGTVVLIQ